MTAETFITQFHTLPGKTVKEKQQNLFKLLRKNSFLKNNSTELQFITTNLKPKTHLEKIFYLDFLIYFRRFSELYANFVSGDDITIKKVSKLKWFYHEAYKDVCADKFVDVIMPTLSYSLKKKILKKLPVDENRANEIFDAIQKRYGIFLATDFLPKCTSKKIRDVLRNNPNKLTQTQLRVLYEKDPDLIYVYFQERLKYEEGLKFLQSNHHILIHIAQRNPEMFANLFDKYRIETQLKGLKLGRRTTKNFINSQKNKVIHKLENYINNLNHGVVVRKLGNETKRVLFKKSNTNEFYWQSILKHYPKSQQFTIYRTTYDSIHYQKFGENVDMVSEDILKLIWDSKERHKIAKLKYEKDGNETYLKYVTPQYCFEVYMEKIDLMAYQERSRFVQIATECCILSKDLDSLLKMCELVAAKFKNDKTKVLESFFSALGKDVNFLDEFTEKHWNFIIEILESANHRFLNITEEKIFWTKNMEFLIKNNRDIKNTIKKYPYWHHRLTIDDFYEQHVTSFKPLINEMIETGYVDKIFSKNQAEEYDCYLACVCSVFNKYNPDDMIPVYDHPRILKSAKLILEQAAYSCQDPTCLDGIYYIVYRSSSATELQELKKLYFEAFSNVGQTSGLEYFLKYEPELVLSNFDHVGGYFGKAEYVHSRSLWRYIKKYSFLGLDTKFVELYKQKLGEKGPKHKREFTIALPILDTPDSYLEFIKPYIPPISKVDLSVEESKNVFDIQTKLIRFMHLVNSPRKILPTVLEFCRGDYLKCARTPLQSCLYKLPENEIRIFIDKLSKNKALSAKKQALNCVIYDLATVYNLLKNTTVPSLVPTLKHFAKNPSDALWELILHKMDEISKKDLGNCQSLVHIIVPPKYRNSFVEALWKLLDKHEDFLMKKTLMTKIGKDTVKNLNSEFVLNIMRDYIWKFDDSDDFFANLLLYVNDDRKFAILSNALHEWKVNNWNCTEAQSDARRRLEKFIVTLFEKYLEAEKTDEKFVSQLSTSFKSIFSLSETFEEYVVILSMAFKDSLTENCSKLLLDFNNHTLKDYSNYVINRFADALKKYVFRRIFIPDNEKIALCYLLFKMKKSSKDDLLILALLSATAPEDAEHFVLYDEMIQALSQSDDDVVRLKFNEFLDQS